jgi:hypothetical protein
MDMMAEPVLPQPNDGFGWVQLPDGPALVCGALSDLAPHLFTTRFWRLGSGQEQPDETAWRGVARAVGVDPAALVRLRQVHGAGVVTARPGPPRQADGLVTDNRSIAVAVQAADCVPLLLADRQTGAVAAAHAGWRGLAAGVPAAIVAALAREFGSHAGHLVAVIGPAIGACCYEVGDEVRQRFAAAGFAAMQLERWFRRVPAVTPQNQAMPRSDRPARPAHWFLDIWAVTRDLLEGAGVQPGHIFEAGLCTASHAALCSYRRDAAQAGRLAAVIRCAPPRPSPGSPADRRGRSPRGPRARS